MELLKRAKMMEKGVTIDSSINDIKGLAKKDITQKGNITTTLHYIHYIIDIL
jgi:ribosomal protein L5